MESNTASTSIKKEKEIESSVEISHELSNFGEDEEGAEALAKDKLYEINGRPTRDFSALESVIMVLKQKKKGKQISVTALKNQRKLKALRKKTIEPSVAALQKNKISLNKVFEDLTNLRKAIEKKEEMKGTKTSMLRHVDRGLKAMTRAIPAVNHFIQTQKTMINTLERIEMESKKNQHSFEVLTDSVLSWGKNVIKWHPPNPWEFDRLPMSLYQLRIYNSNDDPAEKFSTNKKKRDLAKAKRKRREAVVKEDLKKERYPNELNHLRIALKDIQSQILNHPDSNPSKKRKKI